MNGIRVAHVTTVDLTLRFLLLGQLRRLRDEGFEVTTISAPGPWIEDLRREGFRHIPWNHATRSWNLAADVQAFRELLGVFRRERFDVVHTHNPKPGIMGRVAARLAGVPCVVNTVHGLYATPEDRPLRRFAVLGLERIAARFSDFELYQSEEDLSWARRVGLVRRSRSLLLGNGTDVSRFSPDAVDPERSAGLRRELGIPKGAVVVGTVGRLVAEKGYHELFEAARRIRATTPKVAFVAVGSSDTDKDDAISQHSIDEAGRDVVFAGWREDVRDLLAVMDVFVLPSWREGVPRSAIEAAAMGRAMVLTDIRGCREVARDGREAVLVPPRDPDQLTEAIGRLVRDRALRKRLGEAARKRALERFDEQKVMDTVITTYEALFVRKGIRGTPSAGTNSIRVRAARPADAGALARIHRAALRDAFLSSLGERFLRRLYRAIASDEASVAVVAENGEGVVGFAAGTVSVRGFYRRFFRRHALGSAVNLAPRVLRPSVARRAWETAAYPADNSELPESELLSIAVDPRRTSQGIGALLVKAMLDGLAEHGVDRVKVIVAQGNEGANRFYERQGFTHHSRIDVHAGTPSNVWVSECPS
jgi:glycosyltransferase involved in cell wall biosynthesis/ribosomal protein S18 acetylase RimI-like enzyme